MTPPESTSSSLRTTTVRRLLRSRIAMVLCAAVTALGIASVAWGRVGTRNAASAPLYFVGDTTIVFGPDTNFATNGHKTTHVEVLGVAVQAGKQYTIRLTRIGSGKLNQGTVTLNHYPLTDKKDFAASGTVLNLPVKLVGADTLVVEVDGGATDGLVVWILSNTDATVPVYANTYTKTSGPKFDTTATFTPATATGAPAYLYVNAQPVTGFNRATAEITLNGETIVEDKHDDFSSEVPAFAVPVTLRAGSNTLRVIERGTNPARFSLEIRATTKAPPVLTISSPAPNLITKNTTLPVSGTVTDATSVTVTVNGITAALGSGNSYSATVPLAAEGNNVITVHAVNAAGLSTDSTRTVTRDTQPPALLLSAPADQLLTNSDSVTVSGTVTDASALTLTVQGVPVVVVNGAFLTRVALNEGPNFILVTATDAATNAVTLTRQVNRDKTPPILAVTSPANGATTSDATIAVAGTVSDASAVTVTVNGNPVAVVSGAFATTAALATGVNTITVVATDAATNVTTVTRSVTRSAGTGPTPMTELLPADPSIGAPILPKVVSAPTALATAFLYSGPNPIQTGVQAGAIDSARAGALRGRVLDRSGQPVVGVNVTVLGHPELGQTLTRAGGLWDLAVNGGGDVTVRFSKSNVLPVQRSVALPWQKVRALDDVILTPLSPTVTTIDFSQPVQVARGDVSTDVSGSRRLTMLFKQGTVATVVSPDGSTQAVSTLHVRASEFTVGDGGPKAMPAPLPPTSAYTYAVDLNADEALNVGGSVRFSQPVPVYLENFLGFAVGTEIPVGYYDYTTGRWVPEKNGKVIKILSVSAGNVAIDFDGDGIAESNAVLDSLGISAAGRSALSSLYTAGQSLWRWSADHFSPHDFNWPQIADLLASRSQFRPSNEPHQNHDTQCPGCVLSLQNQSAGEQIGIQGTPYALVYSSDRAPGGSRHANILRIPVTGPNISPTLSSVDVTIEVAGRKFQQTFAPLANQSLSFEWDGRDAYGRSIRGATARVSRLFYASISYTIPITGSAFGAGCQPDPSTGACIPTSVMTRINGVSQDATDIELFNPDNEASSLAGWSLSAHHAFDPSARTITAGDGQVLAASAATAPGAVRFAGSNVSGNTGDGGQALQARFSAIAAVTSAPDGSVYVSDSSAHVVRRIGRDGIVTRVAGTGVSGSGAPGASGTSTALNKPAGLAVDRDGTLYIADEGNNRVLRLSNGTITLVAGDNGPGLSGDGGPATAAQLNAPARLAMTSGGGLLVLELGNARVREVAADGTIRPYAGGGADCSTDGIAAIASCFNPVDLAVLSDGRVAIATNNRIRVVDLSGTIRTLAGNGTLGSCGNHDVQIGVSAFDAGVCPIGMTAGLDGSLYLTELAGQLLRRITPAGLISQVRSCAKPLPSSLSRGASVIPQASVVLLTGYCKRLDASSDGALYMTADSTIDRIDQILPKYRNAAFRVPSEDGSEIYEFSDVGQHLRTFDALTNATLLTFAYDAQGRLASVADIDNNVTTIQRDAGGAPTAIISPYGETTTLTVDGNGRLVQVTNPASESVTLGYTAGGALQSVTDPRGNLSSRFAYDSLGRITAEQNAIGGSQSFVRSIADNADTVRVTDALGRARAVSDSRDRSLVATRVSIDAAGLQTTSAQRVDGVTVTSSSDQTVVTQATMPDPRFGAQVRNTTQSTVRLPDNSTADVFFGRKVQLSNPTDPASLVTQTDTLVVAGQTFRGVYTAATRTFVTTSPEGRSSTMQLDPNGRVTQVTTAGLAPINYSYDARGRLLSVTQGDRAETYAYNAQGRLTSVTDPLSRVTSFSYDTAGRVTSETLPGARTVGFAYDSAGNLTSLTPPGKPAHTFAYNAANLPSGYQAPAVSGSTGTTSYMYSVQKELLSLTRPDSQVVSVGYDAAGRPVSVTTAEGIHGIGYDVSTGQVTSLSAPHGVAQSVTYNGALSTGASWTGPVTGNVQYTYDNAFRLSGILVNGNGVAGPSYDRDGLPVTNGFLQMTYRSDNGLLVNLSAANYSGKWSYDSLAQVRTYMVVNELFGDTLFSASYTYDKLGRITQLAERLQADTATYAYGYDAAGRLATVKKSGATVAAYSYDLNGNRLQATYPSGNVVGAVDNQDRLLSFGSNTYAYTGNGELKLKVTGADSTKYRYDAFGNLRDVYLPTGDHIEYVIDAQQRRIGRKLNGTLQKGWLYQSQLAIAAEVDVGGTVTKTFEYATHGNVPDWMYANGVPYRIVTDHLGSVRLVVDVNGMVAQRIDYDAYGRVLTNTNPGFQPFGYAGGLLDDVTGLTRFGARDYDSEIGRWTTRDPMGVEIVNGNAYSYSEGRPTFQNDISGQCPWCIAVVVGAFVGGGVDLALQLIEFNGRLACVDWGSVLTGAITGALTSGLAPEGWLLGRGGIRAARFGFNQSPGILNRGALRFGWTNKGSVMVLGTRRGGEHIFDVLGSELSQVGARPVRNGVVAGLLGGEVNRLTRGQNCGCQ